MIDWIVRLRSRTMSTTILSKEESLDLAKEIERLKKESSLHEMDAKNFQACWNAACEDVHILKQRIEELEQIALQALIPLNSDIDKCHILTDDKIDAAWQHRDDYAYGFTVPQAVEAALKECGIERCEKCDGHGVVDVREPDTAAIHNEDCPSCHGHGWVKGADDE
jgi:hypothetical protein